MAPTITAFIFFLTIIPLTTCSYHMVPANPNFSFPHLDPNVRGFTFRNSAAPMDTGFELTGRLVGQGMSDVVGRAMYSSPIHLWDDVTGNMMDFTTHFTFSINSSYRDQHGDGLAFFLAPNGSYDMPNNSHGGYLGLADEKRNGTGPTAFVAVEVDTYYDMNPWDPRCVHIGIDVNNISSVGFSCVGWLEAKIQSNGLVNASITYNSTSQNLSTVLTDVDDPRNNSTLSHVVDLKQYLPEEVIIGFTATTGWAYELHTIHSWDFSSNLLVAAPDNETAPVPMATNGKTNRNRTAVLVISITGALALISLVLGLAWRCLRSREEKDDESSDILSIDEEFRKVAGPKKFSYKELVKATDDFDNERLLGRGGFGKVYKGYFPETGLSVAIKKIAPESKQGVKEFATEVKTISQLRQRNLVQLIGWCHNKEDLLLIYEFMSNGSLDFHLFKGYDQLPWEMRFRISKDVASAVLYLHEGWDYCILHRDIKCSNVMLDSDYNAKLGDFGLARLVDHSKGSRTTMVAGTLGYMAPESFYEGRSSKETDVYSFGVVLLEIVCGRKVVEMGAAVGQANLVDWVRELYCNGMALDSVDKALDGNFDPKEVQCVLTVGLWCTHPDFSLRPSIREAINTLNFDSSLPTLPAIVSDRRYTANSEVPSSINDSATTGSDQSAFSIECSTSTTSSTKFSYSPSSALLRNTH